MITLSTLSQNMGSMGLNKIMSNIKTAKLSNSESNDLLVCPHCREESKIPTIVTCSVCYGCRFRDDKIKWLTGIIKQIHDKLEYGDFHQWDDGSEVWAEMLAIAAIK